MLGRADLPDARFNVPNVREAVESVCSDRGAADKMARFMTRLIAILLAGVAAAAASGAMQPPRSESTAIAALEQEAARYRHILSDWAGLTRYGSENSELGPPAPGEQRVVFLGDQITELWGQGAAKFFPDKPYLNRGIRGQTTPQMLVRFRQDVIALKPRVVVILGGTNDLTGVLGPGTEGTVGDSITSMTELAKANGIRVVLASVTPVCDCFKDQTSVRPQGKIIGLNGWITEYAARSGSTYLDYYGALAEGRNFRLALTRDGLLPNDAGYAVMAPLAEQAIARALAQK
jgi:lysophospholipase L1-like esterase